MCAVLTFALYGAFTRHFFLRRYQTNESNCNIRILEDDSLAKIKSVIALSSSLYIYLSPWLLKLDTTLEKLLPLYQLLYDDSCHWISIFNRGLLLHIYFLFEIDHDNRTITGILSHLLGRYEPNINWHLVYRHRDNYCINYYPLYWLFV